MKFERAILDFSTLTGLDTFPAEHNKYAPPDISVRKLDNSTNRPENLLVAPVPAPVATSNTPVRIHVSPRYNLDVTAYRFTPQSRNFVQVSLFLTIQHQVPFRLHVAVTLVHNNLIFTVSNSRKKGIIMRIKGKLNKIAPITCRVQLPCICPF